SRCLHLPRRSVQSGFTRRLRDGKNHIYYGHIIHGDPVSAEWNRVPLNDGSLGYAVGKVLNAPSLCDELALQGWAYLRIVVAKATSCFPEVKPPESRQPT
ncbi:MAG: hypothetical protein JW955_13535, partial [Sedimentisphaerales bacterium]|nr:hypothetical protein [Sedimentisphaerales bacterium]